MYNPIEDENKLFTFDEWLAEFMAAAKDYHQVFAEEPRNDFHKKSHTFDEWSSSFRRYMSF